MSTDQTTNLGLPFLMPAQAQKHVTVNESLTRLDALVQAVVESRSVSVQPGSPGDGQMWIAPAGKTGAEWGGYANWALAYYRDGAWEALAPQEGWRVWIKDEGLQARFDGAVWSANQTVSSLNGGPLGGLRNAVMNGGFDVWQRGDSDRPDRWRSLASAGTTPAFSRQAHPLGEPLGAGFGEPRDYMRWLGAGTASGQPVFGQKIEGVATMAAQDVTVSFFARADSARTLQTRLVQDFGSGGSTSVFSAPVSHAVTTAWQRFVTFVSLASLSGKTLGANDNFQLRFYGEDGVDDQRFDIDLVQLELGGVATPFERRPVAAELAMCQRYYELTGAEHALQTFLIAQAFSGNQVRGHVPFTVRKRAAPSVVFNGAPATWAVDDASGAQLSAAAVSAAFVTPVGFEFNLQAAVAGLVAGNAAEIRANNSLAPGWAADAEL